MLLTVEEGSEGGFGSHVLSLLAREGALDAGLKVRTLTLPDVFHEHDKPDRLYAAAGLTPRASSPPPSPPLGASSGGFAERRA